MKKKLRESVLEGEVDCDILRSEYETYFKNSNEGVDRNSDELIRHFGRKCERKAVLL